MPSGEQLRAIFRDVELGVSIPGVALTVLLLSAIAYLQWNPVSRPHLNRVSFRLLVYALAGNVVLGSTLFPNVDQSTPDSGCRLLSFLGVFAPVFSASMFCSIAINLQLVLIYGVNGNRMEKYYLMGGVFLTSACTVPAALADQLAWYAKSGVCIRLRDPRPATQLRWLIAAESIPLVSMAAVELFSIVRITIFMVQHATRLQRLRGNGMTHSIGAPGSSAAFISSLHSKHPIVQYRSMIIRIALYPLPSCFLSITACILDVLTIRGTQFSVPLGIFDVTLFTLRPFIYAVFAATDPAFIHALKSLNLPIFSRCTTESAQAVTADSFVLTAVEFAVAPLDAEIPGAKGAAEDTAARIYDKHSPQGEAGSSLSAQAEDAAERGYGKHRSHWEAPSPITLGGRSRSTTAVDVVAMGRRRVQEEGQSDSIVHQI
ncbi:hypothetical protein DFH06DRAFT_1226818 [Mycena polygramma]|nr:hypothetical protein DFH06DRAFT_1226818 [Mycena polygramma]